MKKRIKSFALVASIFLATMLGSTQAMAHPGTGNHAEFSLLEMIQHLLASPYHTGVIIGVALVLAVVIWKFSNIKDLQ